MFFPSNTVSYLYVYMYWLLFLKNHSITTTINAENFCVNCVHFKKHWLSSTTFGRCAVFPKESENKIDYLISGKPEKEFKFCSTARMDENMCGPKGKYFQKKCNTIEKLYIKNKNNNNNII